MNADDELRAYLSNSPDVAALNAPDTKPTKRRETAVTSEPEETLFQQIALAGLPSPQREYRFHDSRRWRFDFAWVDLMLAVEIEGGTWSRGRHVRGQGFADDCEKYNNAALLGWRVLRFTTEMVNDQTAVTMLMEAIQ